MSDQTPPRQRRNSSKCAAVTGRSGIDGISERYCVAYQSSSALFAILAFLSTCEYSAR